MKNKYVNIHQQLLQFQNCNPIKSRNRSTTRQKVRIAKGLPKDFFRQIKTEQQILQYQYNDDGLKTPAFKGQNIIDTRYKQFFPNKKQISLEVPQANTLPLRKQLSTRLYLSRQQINRDNNNSREKSNSYRHHLNSLKQNEMKSISSQRQQIKFKTKLNIDIICTDSLQDPKENKIRKNVSKFFAEGTQNIKRPKGRSQKLPPLLI